MLLKSILRLASRGRYQLTPPTVHRESGGFRSVQVCEIYSGSSSHGMSAEIHLPASVYNFSIGKNGSPFFWIKTDGAFHSPAHEQGCGVVQPGSNPAHVLQYTSTVLETR